MRIIGGTARGRRLLTPKDNRIRPTADRVKESLFNILSSQLGSLHGLTVVDIFAGTGNLGLEAVSRGASRCYFIDNNRHSTELIQRNLEHVGFADQGEVVIADVRQALVTLERRGVKVDIVFMDPPYGQGLAAATLEELAARNLLTPHSVVVVETDRHEALDDVIGPLTNSDRRRYGDTTIHFYRPAHEGGYSKEQPYAT
ncbi:MAG TPA: 16S rRNA (guanine(966)-N(2))-methyltransferase RsmD [Geobacterales bacterium]|nr:16S rRNA (guanine(966)-N(2))-methyltransferase RsmD [Geobacterales bacterium]